MPDPTDPRAVADDPSGIVQQMPEVTAEALKPCPFCAGKADIEMISHGLMFVYCTGCSTETPLVYGLRHEAIAAWNLRADTAEMLTRRATEADLRAEVERLQGMIDAAAGIFANCNVESGICCCGEAMDGHSLPMSSNHSPVDQGNYAVDRWLKAYKSLSPETDGVQDG